MRFSRTSIAAAVTIAALGLLAAVALASGGTRDHHRAGADRGDRSARPGADRDRPPDGAPHRTSALGFDQRRWDARPGPRRRPRTPVAPAADRGP